MDVSTRHSTARARLPATADAAAAHTTTRTQVFMIFKCNYEYPHEGSFSFGVFSLSSDSFSSFDCSAVSSPNDSTSYSGNLCGRLSSYVPSRCSVYDTCGGALIIYVALCPIYRNPFSSKTLSASVMCMPWNNPYDAFCVPPTSCLSPFVCESTLQQVSMITKGIWWHDVLSAF